MRPICPTRWLFGAISAVLAAVFCAAFGASSVRAKEKAETFFLLWVVEPATIDREKFTVRKGDFVQKTRLLPVGLAEADEDIRLPNGGQLISGKGDQLLQLAGGGVYGIKPTSATVYCQAKAEVRTSKGLIGSSKYESRFCLIDFERDGSFDGAFPVIGCPYEIPLLGLKAPKQGALQHLDGSRYRTVPVAGTRNAPSVGIVYSGIAPLDGDPRFFTAFGSGTPIPLFGEKHTKAGDVSGQRVSFGGAAFTILNKSEKSIEVRNDRPIPSQPFVIVRNGAC